MLSREGSTDSCVFCRFYGDECCDTSGFNFVICANGRPWVGTEVRIKRTGQIGTVTRYAPEVGLFWIIPLVNMHFTPYDEVPAGIEEIPARIGEIEKVN